MLGIGPEKVEALIAEFHSVEKCLSASTEASERVPNFGPETARSIPQILTEPLPTIERASNGIFRTYPQIAIIHAETTFAIGSSTDLNRGSSIHFLVLIKLFSVTLPKIVLKRLG